MKLNPGFRRLDELALAGAALVPVSLLFAAAVALELRGLSRPAAAVAAGLHAASSAPHAPAARPVRLAMGLIHE